MFGQNGLGRASQWYGLLGLIVIGLLAGVIASLNPANVSPSVLSFGPLLGLAVGIFVGIDAGRRKSFNLKLQAQQLLCQRKIELNTRAAG
jgi:hypothetical protein